MLVAAAAAPHNPYTTINNDAFTQDHGAMVAKELSKPHALPFRAQFVLLMKRQFLLTIRNRQFLRAKMAQNLLMGTLSGTLFYQMDLAKASLHFGLLFFAVMFQSLGGMAAIPAVVEQRDVAYKQMDSKFFSPIAYASVVTIVQVPFDAAFVLVFSTIMYWLTGLCTEVHAELACMRARA
jgi:ABC-type multidrug transport system permease subunit